jgi:hypothetical protein
MRREIPAGLLIGAVLSKKSGKVEFSEFYNICLDVLKKTNGYCADLSRDRVLSEIQANGDCFTLRKGTIQLRDDSEESLREIEDCFYSVLDGEIREALDARLQPMLA